MTTRSAVWSNDGVHAYQHVVGIRKGTLVDEDPKDHEISDFLQIRQAWSSLLLAKPSEVFLPIIPSITVSS